MFQFRVPVGLRATLILLPFLVACGGGGNGGSDPPTGPSPPPVSRDLMPLGVGDRWIYSDQDARLQAAQVTGTRDAQGHLALVVLDTDLETGHTEESLLLKSETGIVVLPDTSDSVSVALGAMPTLKLPAIEGESQVLLDRSITDGYDLDDDGRPDAMHFFAEQSVLPPETVNVAAGQFVGCTPVRVVLQLSVNLSSGGAVQSVTTLHQWLAPGVGLVRETSETVVADQRVTASRTLVSYAVGGQRSESRPPTVVRATPAAGAVVGQTSLVQVQFDEPMDLSTLNQGGVVLRRANGEEIAGTWTRSGAPSTFNLALTSLPSGRYTVSLTSLATDFLGNPATPLDWTFDVDISGP